jgi:uncharacterized protein (TIGR00299 family) protein
MILYLDCSSGVSGDMLAAALLAVAAGDGEPAAVLDAVVRPALAAIGIDPGVVSAEPVSRAGFQALRFVVREEPGFATMSELVAAAERAVHGDEGEHLHELAGLDTAVDLVSVAALIDHLAPAAVVSSSPALGSGSVATAHGRLPVPAPAVAELLRGLPTLGDGAGEEPGELTTPTGAALLAHFATRFGTMPAGAVVACGHGAGARDTVGWPNVLRAFLIDADVAVAGAPAGAAGAAAGADDLVLLETNIDDCSPELLAAAADEVRAVGALDVWLSPALMKKGRLGTVIHVLAQEADRERLAALLLRETTTFGVRILPVGRILLEERREVVTIEGGDCAVRLGYQGGELVTASPEFEDCRALARRLGWPLQRVYEEVAAAARRRFGAS